MIRSTLRTVNEQAARRALAELCEGLFDPLAWIDECAVVDPRTMPEIARRLLAHNGHMTPTLRAHYGGSLALSVEADALNGELYRRKILLTSSDSGRVVELGVVRIHLQYVPAGARSAILDKTTPLGDILAQHSVLTRVEPIWYLRFPNDAHPVQCLRAGADAEVFGRVATIHCDGQEAVELLEVVAT